MLWERNLPVPNQKVGHAADQEESVSRGDGKLLTTFFIFFYFVKHFTTFIILPSLFLVDSWNPDLSRLKESNTKKTLLGGGRR